jgi:uncharacterized protein YaaQ
MKLIVAVFQGEVQLGGASVFAVPVGSFEKI